VAQADVRLHRLELDAQPQGVAEGAVAVGQAAEQVGVRPVGGHVQELARAGEDVHVEHRLVGRAVAEAAALDAEPDHRAAERDRLELRHDERHQSVGERRVDELLVRRHAEHVGGARHRVDLEDAGEHRDVEAALRRVGAGAEQVARRLAQAHRCVGGQRRQLRAQAGDGRVVGGPVEDARTCHRLQA
jgi:hypothetical protein